LIHILAVSGLHVGFVVLILLIVVDLVRIPRRWQWLVIIIGLIFYAHLTSLKPPVVRAAIMAGVILIGQAFERDTNLFNCLGVAAIIILLWQPLQLFQLGFQLSFAAVAGIAFLYRPLSFWFSRVIRWRWRIVRWAVALLAVSLAAQLATLPFSVTAFGRLPVTAIWGNLVVIPGAFVIVATAAVACMMAPLSSFVSSAYGAVADLTATALIAFTRWLATIPMAYVEGIHIPFLLLVSYVFALATLAKWRRRARRWLLPATLVTLNLYIWPEALAARATLRVTFFDIGQGDSALLEFPNGNRLLIDTGPIYDDKSAAGRVLVPYFHRYGIRRLQAVIISHPHSDHLGGLPTLLNKIKIDTVYHCGVRTESGLAKTCNELMDSLRIPSRVLRAGDQLGGFGPAQIWTLLPRNGERQYRNFNDASVVVKILFGEVSLLFPGDSERPGEARMLE